MSQHTKIALPVDADASGRSFGKEELELLERVIASGTLNSTKGTLVTEFERAFAEHLGVSASRACASGTAAIHAAVAAIDPEPGDEIISSPITDMGAITPILYQTAIPIFADVDPETYNVTAETIERKITPRTKAVIVTHLFGNACDMDPIVELCSARGIPIIEDCAQAYGSTYRGRKLGTIGAIGCFSLQQGKHITAGEGGIVVSSDAGLFRRMRLFIDKAWGYGDPKPDHYFLAPNYRMTEMQGAVALAQLRKLGPMLEQRVRMADLLTSKIQGIPGVRAPKVTPGAQHTYWKYCLRVDGSVVREGAVGLGRELREAGIFCAPRYIQKPAFECEVLRDQKTFGNSGFPFRGPHRAGLPDIVYDRADTPGTIEALRDVLVIGWNEKMLPEHVEFIASEIRQAAERLSG